MWPFKRRSVAKEFVPPANGVRPVVLLSLDGWGVAPASSGNAIDLAKTPNMDRYQREYAHGVLVAAGESVGLPANEAGNSEVGHLTMGAGRATLQSLQRIDAAIADGSFFENLAFEQALSRVREKNSKLHLMGLVSSGGVHSSLAHLEALLELCARKQFKNVYVHAFTDGRDAAPSDGLLVMRRLEEKMKSLGVGKIATVMGRYYAMDRDRRWERTEKAYKAMVLGEGLTAASAASAIQQAYDKGVTDEFIEPTVITQIASSTWPVARSAQESEATSYRPQATSQAKPAYAKGNGEAKPVATIDDNDGVIFFNFRIDRPRQLTMALTVPDFENLKDFKFGFDPYRVKYEKHHGNLEVYSGKTFVRSKWPKEVFLVTMTEYQSGLPVSAIAFPPPVVEQTVASVVADQGWPQLRLAESEKERMVTYYFDGMREERYPQEEVVIVPSPKVATYDKKPEMAVFLVVAELKKALEQGKYRLIMMNFANPDMVAHSGDLKATIKACEYTDRAMGEVVEMVLEAHGVVVITADHGNAEDLLTYQRQNFFYTTKTGLTNTEHSNHLVPLVIVGEQFSGKGELKQGTLADVAPTLLGLLGLVPPVVMTGKNLLE